MEWCSRIAYLMNFVNYCLKWNLNATFTTYILLLQKLSKANEYIDLLDLNIPVPWKLNFLYLHHPSSFSGNLFNFPMNFVLFWFFCLCISVSQMLYWSIFNHHHHYYYFIFHFFSFLVSLPELFFCVVKIIFDCMHQTTAPVE